jgi:hypothetical protein
MDLILKTGPYPSEVNSFSFSFNLPCLIIPPSAAYIRELKTPIPVKSKP